VSPSHFDVEPWLEMTGRSQVHHGVLIVEPPPDHPAFTAFLVKLAAIDPGCATPAQPGASTAHEVAVRLGYEGSFAYSSSLEEAAVGNGTLFLWTIEAQHTGNGPAIVDLNILDEETTAGVVSAGGRLVLDASSRDGPAARTTVIELRPNADTSTTAVLELTGRYAGPMPYEPDVARITVRLPAATPPDHEQAASADIEDAADAQQIPAPGIMLALLGIALAAYVGRRA
jgi:hypothetical protein